MARKVTAVASAGAHQANQSPVRGALVQLAPQRECLIKLRYAHARPEVLGVTLRFRLESSIDIEQYDINPTLSGSKRDEVEQRLAQAFELLCDIESFHDGLQTLKELEAKGECVGFRLSSVSTQFQGAH